MTVFAAATQEVGVHGNAARNDVMREEFQEDDIAF
jgi:hypothetical protein